MSPGIRCFPIGMILLGLALGRSAAVLAQEPAPRPRVTGQVVDTADKPVPGARVWLCGPGSISYEGPPVLDEAAADAQGHFLLEPEAAAVMALDLDQFVVWAEAPGYEPAARRGGIARMTTPPLRLSLRPEGTTVVQIRDEAGRGVPGARVFVRYPNAFPGELPTALAEQTAATTDDQGRAVLRRFGPDQIGVIAVTSPAYGRQLFSLVSDMDRSRDEIRLTLGPVASVRGQIVGPDHAPVPGVTLRIHVAHQEQPPGEPLRMAHAKVTTDAQGRFVVPALMAGEMRGFDGRSPETFRLAFPGIPARVTRPGETVDLRVALRATHPLRGQVIDAESRQPVAGVHLHCVGDPRRPVVTDVQGRYEVWRPPGPAYVNVQKPPPPYLNGRGNGVRGTIPDHPDGLTLPPLSIERGRSVTGRVIAEDGHMVAGARVVAAWAETGRPSSAPWVEAFSDAEGRFQLDGVPLAGNATVLVHSWGEGLATGAGVSLAGEDFTVLRVSAGNVIPLEVHLRDNHGQPVADARVRITMALPADARGQAEASLSMQLDSGAEHTTGPDGVARWDWLVPRAGRYSAASWTNRYALAEQTERVAPAPADARLILPITTTRLRIVAGRITDRAGQPVPGVSVFQSGESPRRTEATSDADGRFQLDGVNDAPALVFARKEGFRFAGRAIPAGDAARLDWVIGRVSEPPLRRLSTRPIETTDPGRQALLDALAEALAVTAADDRHPEANRALALSHLATIDPARVERILRDTPLSLPSSNDRIRAGLALGLRIRGQRQEAEAVLDTLSDPASRAQYRLRFYDALPGHLRREHKNQLVRAAFDAREIGLVTQRIYLQAMIVNRWLEIDDRLKSSALLGMILRPARELPPQLTRAGVRAEVAIGQARFDLNDALRLLPAKVPPPETRRALGRIAAALAPTDPAAAEAVLARMQGLPVESHATRAVVLRMALNDIERARRLLDRVPGPLGPRALVLGELARMQADAGDLPLAREWLAEAWSLLAAERAGSGVRNLLEPWTAAAAGLLLLPVSERLEPDRVEERLFEALALRGIHNSLEQTAAEGGRLAALVSRYDPELAQGMVVPVEDWIAEVRRDPAGGAAGYLDQLLGRVVADPAGAQAMVEAASAPRPPNSNAFLLENREVAAFLVSPNWPERWRLLRRLLYDVGDPENDAP